MHVLEFPISPSERRSLILCVYEVIRPTADLAGIFERMVRTPLNVEVTFRHLLGLVERLNGGQIPWHRVGHPPNAAEMMRLKQLAPTCTCCINPLGLCDMHPCHCKMCAKGPVTSCSWRHLALEFLSKNVLLVGTLEDLLAGYKDSLTYIQVLEAYGGQGPASGRERNLLNIMALLPSLQPIGSTNGIFDKSKGLGRGGLRTDGTVGTMLTSSSMWSFDDGG